MIVLCGNDIFQRRVTKLQSISFSTELVESSCLIFYPDTTYFEIINIATIDCALIFPIDKTTFLEGPTILIH